MVTPHHLNVSLVAGNPAFPRELAEKESEFIAHRRRAVGRPERAPLVGLALSGGGVRSATFALGVLQSLAKARLLSRFDYLSTVSGGGYIGAFLGALFARPEPKGVAPDQGASRVDRVEQALGDGSGPLVRWLRENGRYLSPNGAGDVLLAGAVALRNWIAVHLVLGTLALAAFVALVLARMLVSSALGARGGFVSVGAVAGSVWWSPTLILPLLIVAVWSVPAGWAYWLVPPPKTESKRSWQDFGPLGTAVVIWASQVLAWLAGWRASGDVASALALTALITTSLTLGLFAVAAVRAILDTARVQHDLSVWLKSSLTVAFALGVLAVLDSLGQTSYVLVQHGALWRWLTPIPLALAGTATIGQKLLSLAGGDGSAQRAKPRWAALTLVFAFLLAGIELVFVSGVSHAIAWQGRRPPEALAQGVLSRADDGADVKLSADRHVVVVHRDCPPCTPPAPADGRHTSTASLALVCVGLLGLSWSFGRTRSFMNQSSLAALYGARLRRAYLGASNPQRSEATQSTVTRDVSGDDLDFESYRPWTRGGPLHLVNVTFNETVSGESRIEQRDRKGLPTAFGPAGVSVGVRHHARWEQPETGAIGLKPVSEIAAGEPSVTPSLARFLVFDPKAQPILPESMTLSRLIAVSGAAVSTGLGSRTSLGVSLLIGLLNLRLGHWWRSGVDPAMRSAAPIYTRKRIWASLGQAFSRGFSVQAHLLDEFLARFHGPARRNWNLSDGGHFENTGCYELIRRRVPLIVVTDDGADPDYIFEDFAHLVRKVRLDFGARLRGATTEELESLDAKVRPYFGDLATIRGARGGSGTAATGHRWNGAHAAIAIIDYSDTEERSLLIWIKPSLLRPEPGRTGAPEDVLHYALEHPSFPQEPTSDQYFDEAQWESYRRLGEHIGSLVFAGEGGVGWRPRDLDASGWKPPRTVSE